MIKNEKEYHKEYNKQYYKNNKDKIKEYTKNYRKIQGKEYWNEVTKDIHNIRKLQAISYYSNNTMECKCCKEKEIMFLTIDHINNNGSNHRRLNKNAGNNFYSWLKKNNYPEGYQVLCFNCNLGKRINQGVCPHNNADKG